MAFIIVAFIFALTGCASEEANQEKAPIPTDMTISVENPQMPVTDQNEIFKAVLLGDSSLFYCTGGNAFVADHQPATEEEYLDAVSRQDQKQNAE